MKYTGFYTDGIIITLFITMPGHSPTMWTGRSLYARALSLYGKTEPPVRSQLSGGSLYLCDVSI